MSMSTALTTAMMAEMRKSDITAQILKIMARKQGLSLRSTELAEAKSRKMQEYFGRADLDSVLEVDPDLNSFCLQETIEMKEIQEADKRYDMEKTQLETEMKMWEQIGSGADKMVENNTKNFGYFK